MHIQIQKAIDSRHYTTGSSIVIITKKSKTGLKAEKTNLNERAIEMRLNIVESNNVVVYVSADLKKTMEAAIVR